MPKSNPWSSLSASTDSSKISARRVTAVHPLDLFWARSASGFLLLVRNVLVPDGDALPRLRGISISTFPDMRELRLSLDMPAEWELFATLCDDLVETTRACQNPDEALKELIRRLERWQRLMAKDGRGVLSESEIRGLLGELTFLHDELLPRFGSRAVAFWNGPRGAAQDFAVGGTCFEIKSRSIASRETVSISSPEQLWPPAGDLFLVSYVLAAAPAGQSGRSLLALVSEIRQKLLTTQTAGDFEERLAEAGYLDLSDYGTVYDIEGPDTFAVTVGFPRLLQEHIPAGLCHVSYDLELDRCRAFRCEISLIQMVIPE